MPTLKIVDPPAQGTPPSASPAQGDALRDCLLQLAAHHGRAVGHEALVAGLPLVDGALTPELFLRAASRVGLTGRIVQRPLASLKELLLPAVLLLKQGACILEERLPDGRLRIFETESAGSRELPPADLEALYSGSAILVRALPRSETRGLLNIHLDKQHWFRDTLLASWPIYAETLLASLLINLFALASPLFVMNVYDRVVPNQALETLWVLALGILVVFCFDLGMRALRGYFLDVAGKRADVLWSSALFERILGMRMAARPGSVGAFANNLHEFESFREFFTSTTLTALVDLPFVLLFVLMIALIGGPLAWVPVLLLPISLLVALLIQIPLARVTQSLMALGSQRQATLIETLTGLETLKVLGAEGPTQRRWEQAIGAIARLSTKARFLSASALNATVFFQQLASVIVVVAGVYLIGAGELSVGALIACTLLTGRALAPLGQIASTLLRFHQARTALAAIDQLMQLPQERPDSQQFLHHATLRGDIEFSNVSFSYPGSPVAALSEVSFRIRAGERVAFIGRIGSGKSTIEKLVLGLDLRQIDPAELRRNIGYVPQDILLFNGSIKSNIAMGAVQPDDEHIRAAADLAGVTEFTHRHPAGLERAVGERGEGLSGGQRQSIALARALVNDSPIVVMDEPSNAMDHNTEDQLKSRLAGWLGKRTVLLVTHRASLLSLVDRVIVLDGGRILADGPKGQVLEALKLGQIRVTRA